jgi:hypothetical protein
MSEEFEKVKAVLRSFDKIDKEFGTSTAEFLGRQDKVYNALKKEGVSVGFVFSDEHYQGDVPYLGGNTNITIEQVAGVVGKTGFHIVAGLEGGYVAEQLAPRAKAKVHKAELLKLADEKYPIEAERLEDIMVEANDGVKPKEVALLTPRQVTPYSIIEHLESKGFEVVDKQVVYQKVKNVKSDDDMRLIRDASLINNAVIRAMLAVLRPGMYETEVAAWGEFVAKYLGAEGLGFRTIVGAGEANRTLIGKALNKKIREGDYVHLGVSCQRDGLTACIRRSMVAVENPEDVTEYQGFWRRLVEEAYAVGFEEYCRVAREGAAPREQEMALISYFRSKTEEANNIIQRNYPGTKSVDDLSKLKPYTGTHNAGYTECQEFYGAITLDSNEPLERQIVTMLDIALRGVGDKWDDVVIPGFDYWLVENTLGKMGDKVVDFNEKIPVNVQGMVGNVDELTG